MQHRISFWKDRVKYFPPFLPGNATKPCSLDIRDPINKRRCQMITRRSLVPQAPKDSPLVSFLGFLFAHIFQVHCWRIWQCGNTNMFRHKKSWQKPALFNQKTRKGDSLGKENTLGKTALLQANSLKKNLWSHLHCHPQSCQEPRPPLSWGCQVGIREAQVGS